MTMKKGDYIRVPRFGMVKIEHVFACRENAMKRGYIESTDYDDPKYEIVGKRVGVNEFEFSAYLKAGKPVMRKVVKAAEAPTDEPETESTPEQIPVQTSESEQASTPETEHTDTPERTVAKDLVFPKLTGTPKQIKWAEDIRQQVLDAAYMVYADDVESDADYEIAFEDTKVGHVATFAIKYMTSSKFWIDQIGYDITNWKRVKESVRSLGDLEAIIEHLMGKFMLYDDKECSISTRFWAEEEELKPIRSAAVDAMWASYRARKAAEKAEKEAQKAEQEAQSAESAPEPMKAKTEDKPEQTEKADSKPEMTAEQMIEKYDTKLEMHIGDNGQSEPTGRIYTEHGRRMSDADKKEFQDHADAMKAVLMSRWNAKQEEKRKAKEERQAKIDAIEGLQILQDAIEAKEEWRIRFNRSFEGPEAVGGMGTGPEPDVDIDSLKMQYPRAAAYLRAQEMAQKSNWRMADIGRKAVDRIIEEPDNYEAIMEDMDKQLEEFSRAHM